MNACVCGSHSQENSDKSAGIGESKILELLWELGIFSLEMF